MEDNFIARVKKRISKDKKKPRWIVQYEYYDANGKRKQKQVSPKKNTEKAAKELRDELIIKHNAGEKVDAKDITLGQYMKKWLEECKPEIKHTTYRMYEYLNRRYITPKIGHIKMDKLRPAHIQNLYTYCRDTTKLSSSSIRRLHSTLHRALAIAVKREVIPKNIVDMADPPKQKKHKYQVATLEQLLKIINAAKDTHIFAPIFIAVNAGLRRGEILALKWDNIDMDNQILTVAGTLQRKDGKLTVLPPKTEDSYRKIKISQGLLFFLKRHKAQQEELEKIMEGNIYNQGFVCCWEDGRPIDPDYVSKQFHKLVDSLDDVPNIRFHDLRHGFATLLLGEGVPLKIVSDMLGHSSVRVTGDIYSHVLMNMQDTAITKLDSVLNVHKKSTKNTEGAENERKAQER